MLDIERPSSRPFYVTMGIWLGWFAASMVGYLGGEWLGEAIESVIIGPDATRVLSLEGRVELAEPFDYLAAGIGGLVAGVVLGAAQGLVLLPYLKRQGVLEWIAATTVGRMARWLAIFVVGQQMAELVLDKSFAGGIVLFGLLGGLGIIAGLTLGYAQYLVLRRRVRHSIWWVWVNLPGPFLTAMVVAMTLYIEGHNVVRDCSTPMIAAITAAITGMALNDLLNRPTTHAEWYRDHYHR